MLILFLLRCFKLFATLLLNLLLLVSQVHSQFYDFCILLIYWDVKVFYEFAHRRNFMCQGLCRRSDLIDFKLVLLLLLGSMSIGMLSKVPLDLIGLTEAFLARMTANLWIWHSLTKLIWHLVSKILVQHVHHFRLNHLVSCLLHALLHVELSSRLHHIWSVGWLVSFLKLLLGLRLLMLGIWRRYLLHVWHVLLRLGHWWGCSLSLSIRSSTFSRCICSSKDLFNRHKHQLLCC